jgi:hypothetical protein
MAIGGKANLDDLYKQACSSGYYNDLRTFTLAGAKNDGMTRPIARSRTAAMRVTLKTELPRTKASPQQQCRCGYNYRQRNQLLPIHAGKII